MDIKETKGLKERETERKRDRERERETETEKCTHQPTTHFVI